MFPRCQRRRLGTGGLVFLIGAALMGLARLGTGADQPAALLPPPVPPTPPALPVRLHVVAPSDRPADQRLKLQVRDALLPHLRGLAARAGSAAGLTAAARAARPDLETIARKAVTAAGRREAVRIEVGEQDFPASRYGSLSLPAGRYPAVRVVIGAGAGHNWWCVLFPALCYPEYAGRVEAAPGVPGQPEPTPAPTPAPILLDERQMAELPVVPGSALVRWLRQHGLWPSGR